MATTTSGFATDYILNFVVPCMRRMNGKPSFYFDIKSFEIKNIIDCVYVIHCINHV